MESDSRGAGRSAQRMIEINPDVIAQRLGEGIVVVNLQTSRMYDLNRTAARFWELLVQGEEPAVIQARLVEEFDVTEAELRTDLDRALASLREADLVRVPQAT